MPFHTTTHLTNNIYRISEPLGIIAPEYGLPTVNLYLVVGKVRAALIDTGFGVGDVRGEIRQITPLPVVVLNTHYHWDHTGANARFNNAAIHPAEVDALAQEPDVSAYRAVMQTPDIRAALPPAFDPAMYRIIPKPPTRTLRDGEVIDLGGRALKAIHTPGHSPGHIAFFDEASGALFTGDAAYCGHLYACFADSDPAAFAQSVKCLRALRGVKTICPGHNDPITDANWLGELDEALQAALNGRAKSEPPNEALGGREFRFGAFSVWLPL